MLSRTILLAATLILTGAADLPVQGPLPMARPEAQAEVENKPADTPVEAADERPQESESEQAACRAGLAEAGATFEAAPAIAEDGGCGMERPLLLKGLPGGIAVDPPATLRCETALQLTRWMEGSVKPSLRAALPGEAMKTLSQASAYVCRNRNGAEDGKVSEHAFGNAIDIAGFTMRSGKTLAIRPADREPSLEGAFQRAITEAACLYFTTVLDPGSDAAHRNHLHLDVKERRGGYRYCW